MAPVGAPGQGAVMQVKLMTAASVRRQAYWSQAAVQAAAGQMEVFFSQWMSRARQGPSKAATHSSSAAQAAQPPPPSPPVSPVVSPGVRSLATSGRRTSGSPPLSAARSGALSAAWSGVASRATSGEAASVGLPPLELQAARRAKRHRQERFFMPTDG